MSEEDFAACAQRALDTLPDEVAAAMDNVAIVLEEEPAAELLGEEDYDEDGLPTLLGLYDGVPLTERDEGWNLVLPDRILIFSGPLMRWCDTTAQLEEEIRVTILHEIAHHFGIDDDRLAELGWD